MDIDNLMGIWHEIRSETLRNDVFRAFLFSNAKNNMFTEHYELTQLPIRKITNIAQKLKMLGTEKPFKSLVAAKLAKIQDFVKFSLHFLTRLYLTRSECSECYENLYLILKFAKVFEKIIFKKIFLFFS